jgi:uncharacterized protein (DUF952 family)
MGETIFKICPRETWRTAEASGRFDGASVDREHGFIHFSTAKQVAETAARHFAGQEDLVLIGVDAEQLGDALRWETSRGGALFPHLYGPLSLNAVRHIWPLPLGPGGAHLFPADML